MTAPLEGAIPNTNASHIGANHVEAKTEFAGGESLTTCHGPTWKDDPEKKEASTSGLIVAEVETTEDKIAL